ncbi:hypothetical protein [Rhizobium lusitanum]|uniref:Uncharacterized protein n=1 Tax=Rhizobium lusitanum TaxID=293958 RepID=A0A7X0IXT5_9HYPH|nr:hypothetical protein [Rhizobium lusitanum]MBB6487711.1 hypothetical protein [Rhizobium lusitanum]
MLVQRITATKTDVIHREWSFGLLSPAASHAMGSFVDSAESETIRSSSIIMTRVMIGIADAASQLMAAGWNTQSKT